MLALGRGFCIGKAALLAACARAVGIPARVGYADVRNHMTTKRLAELMGSDVFYYHGYTDVWLDGRWLSFDITNNTRRLNQHLRLATGLDYLDACLVRGTRLGGGGEIMLTNAEVREHSQQAQQQ